MQPSGLREGGAERARREGYERPRAGFRFSAMAILGIAMLVLSCGDGSLDPAPPPLPPPVPPPVATTVAVDPESATLSALEETARFTAEVRDQNGQVMSGLAITWASSDTLVAAVDDSGRVTAAANGSATITAAVGSVSGTAAVTVSQVASAVTITPATTTFVALGDTVRLAAEAVDANGHAVEGSEYQWASSNGSVATVDGSGKVRGVGAGTATITATAGEASAAAEITVANPDRAALAAFYRATGGPGWRNDDNWLTAAPLEEWHGVGVDGLGRVAMINMGDNILTGTLPPEIGDLTRLKDLDLTANSKLTGEVPAEFGRLANLERLSFANTRITSLPPEVGNLRSLRSLFLTRTPLTSVPPEFGDLSALGYLDWEEGQLTSLPPEFKNLTSLTYLRLADHDFADANPLRLLAHLPVLATLDLQRNELTGAIPPELGALSSLWFLDLSSNNLEGGLPPELRHLTNLRSLRLSRNAALSGPLPARLEELVGLKELWTVGTDLCAPDTLRKWLTRLTHRMRICGDASGSASAAYLTQAVQSLEYAVPLVAGEPALLRVFPVATNAGGQRLPSARAVFYRNDEEVYRVDISGGGGALTSEVDESSLSASLNADIPAEVIRPGLEMVVEIDPDGALEASLGLGRRVPGEGRLPVAVKAPPALDLTLVPFLWVTNPDVSILRRTDGLTPEDPLFRHMHTLLPVGEMNLTIHEPVEISAANPLNLPFQILGEVDAIRIMEGGAGHYMGTIAGLPPASVAGVAHAPGRAAFSILEPRTMAHELGHNFSLLHAPCRVGGADPLFPYDDGSIGSWGYDSSIGALVSPEHTYDLMSYCGPGWISDFSFSVALGYRVTRLARGTAASARSILIWGGVEADGTPFLEPSFVVHAPPQLPQPGGAGHTIVGRAEDGRELFSLEFTMPTLADGDGGSRFAFAVPVMQDWAALASITLSGNERSFTLDREGDRAVAIVRDPATRRVRAILRSGDAPEFGAAALRDRAAALSARQSGLEVLFSRGIPDLATNGR